MGLSRRSFLKVGACALGTLALPQGFRLEGADPAGFLPAGSNPGGFREAQHYEILPDGRVHCLLCPNGCVRKEGERSKCRVRESRGGKYYSLVYGLPCVIALDPVEKCPLFHFHVPGNAFSIATAGCNLGCQYCQNWQFSQKTVEETRNLTLSPEQVIEKAKEYKAEAVSFFYTEPTIYFEFMKDIAELAKKAGLPTIMVTAGYINPDPLRELFGLIDAFAVGLKGWTEDYYRNVIDGSLKPVLTTLETIAKSGKHLEVVTLVVPTLNDKPEDLKSLAGWVAKNLGPDVPLHFTRFNPQFKLKGLPPTPVGILEEARSGAMAAGIRFCYTGNIPAHEGNHTYCPKCRKLIIERLGIQVLSNLLKGGCCPFCATPIPGRWKS